MNWTPTEYKLTKRDCLEGHYKPPGFPVYDPAVCDELEKEGLLRRVSSSYKDIDDYFIITVWGKDVVEFIRGERSFLYLPVAD